MKNIDSPSGLANSLVELFPEFSKELEDEEIERYHQVFLLLSPRVTGFLEGASERTVKAFCGLLNHMASSGGEKENAVSTSLLEHASQIEIRTMIRPFLNAEARQKLR